MPTHDPDRVIKGEVVIDAGIDEVWDAWTTEDGVRSFFAPDCHIEPRLDVVLERLVYRFSVGPVDWENHPALMTREPAD